MPRVECADCADCAAATAGKGRVRLGALWHWPLQEDSKNKDKDKNKIK
jgi:hypothetical protein